MIFMLIHSVCVVSAIFSTCDVIFNMISWIIVIMTRILIVVMVRMIYISLRG